jgi:hypothetical protein
MKNHRLGPQNGLGSLKPETLIKGVNFHKMVLSQLE